MAESDRNQAAEEETLTFTTKEFNQFLDAMKGVLTETCGDALGFVFQKTFPPMAERMDMIAASPVVLGRALRTNRRDANASEFAKLFIKEGLEDPDEALEPSQIAARAYAIANEMEIHAQVADIQDESKRANLKEHVEAAPAKADIASLVDSFLGRGKDVPKKSKKH